MKKAEKKAEVVSKKTAKAEKIDAKTAKAETTAKKTSKAAKKTVEQKPIEKSVKPVVKKATVKKAEAKAETKKPATKKAEAKFDREKFFPAEIEFEGEKYIRTNIVGDDIVKLYENGEVVLLAVEWPKKFLKQYEEQYDVKAPKGGFENGFDLAQLILVQDVHKRYVTASIVTEALSFFEAAVFEKRTESGDFVSLNSHVDIYLPAPTPKKKK